MTQVLTLSDEKVRVVFDLLYSQVTQVWIPRTESIQVLFLESLDLDLKTTDLEAVLFEIAVEADDVFDETSLNGRQVFVVVSHGLSFIHRDLYVIHITLIRVIARRV